MSLPYGLASGAVVGLAFALGPSGVRAAWALKWLGEPGVFFYVHFAVAEAIGGGDRPGPGLALLAVGGLTATALVTCRPSWSRRGSARSWPWLAVVGMIGAAALAPGLNPRP
ncbi:MAG: hypothetical protein U0835_19085 [Isosphaeraceae bacterium]